VESFPSPTEERIEFYEQSVHVFVEGLCKAVRLLRSLMSTIRRALKPAFVSPMSR